MTASKPRSPKIRFFKMTLLVTAVVAVAIVGLHIWFVNNARNVLKQIVAEKSQGKLKLELKQLSFDFLSSKLQVRGAELFTTDTLTASLGYRVKFRKLTLDINSFWPLLFEKQLLLDS